MLERSLGILLAVEHGLLRDALSAALEREPDLAIVGEASDLAGALDRMADLDPDVALLSGDFVGGNGAHATCLIRERAPRCAIVVLTRPEDRRIVTEGLTCGARGYLTTDCSVSEVVDAVRAVARGETRIPPAILGSLLDDLIEGRRDHERALLKISRLSVRERSVLGLVARGATTAEAARSLVISPETVRTHVQSLLRKLDLHSRLELASFVVDNGLLQHLIPAPKLAAGSGGD